MTIHDAAEEQQSKEYEGKVPYNHEAENRVTGHDDNSLADPGFRPSRLARPPPLTPEQPGGECG